MLRAMRGWLVRRALVLGAVLVALCMLQVWLRLQVTHLGYELSAARAMQLRARIELTPHRGPIVDRHGEALALSLDVPSVYVRPREFGGQDARLAALAAALHLPLPAVRARTASAERFVWLERQVPPHQAEAVERLGLRGVYTVQEGRRFYPHASLAAHVLGFVGVDSQGLEGLERRLDTVIRGEPRDIEADRDGRRQVIFTAGVPAPPAQGSRVELTIDASIQDVTERELAAGVAAAKAAGGAAVVLDPSTGEVLALANLPTFNPNQPGRRRDHGWHDRVRNRAITDPYEPGSTFKAILAAAAIEERVVGPTDMFFCENGRYRIGKWRIHDAHRHGWLSFAQVIQYSSNIGATKVADRLGAARYYRYVRAFGFGTRTGIELPGEKRRLDDFPVAGKTGTAQKVNLHTGAYSSKRIGSFVGFVPADSPRIVILVLIDEPGGSSYGGVVAAPVFRAIAMTVLERLGVESPAPPLQMASARTAPKAKKSKPAPARGARVVMAPAEPSTPSFLGLSRREALARAHAAGWDVQASGIGYVSEQSPPPGAPLARERRLALRLVPGPVTVAP